jgi:hypothetical protein
MAQEVKPGYLRCDVLHIGIGMQFEVLSEQPKVALVTIEAGEGPVQIALNRKDAVRLVQTLELFLKDWPEQAS